MQIPEMSNHQTPCFCKLSWYFELAICAHSMHVNRFCAYFLPCDPSCKLSYIYYGTVERSIQFIVPWTIGHVPLINEIVWGVEASLLSLCTYHRYYDNSKLGIRYRLSQNPFHIRSIVGVEPDIGGGGAIYVVCLDQQASYKTLIGVHLIMHLMHSN